MGFEVGTKYTLTGPDGTIVSFNDSTDGNFIGFVTDIQGLDSAGIDEAGGGGFTERDGGYSGNSYWDRRPIVLSGFIQVGSTLTVDQRIEKFQRARRALRADSTLTWTEQDGIQRRLLLRLQNFVVAKGFPKTFTLGMISASYAIESFAEQSVNDAASPLTQVITNSGNEDAMPRIAIVGAGTSPATITVDAVTIAKLNYAIPVGRTVTIDWRARTAVDDLAVNLYKYIDFAATTWAGIPPGAHTVACDKGTAFTVYWRHTWA